MIDLRKIPLCFQTRAIELNVQEQALLDQARVLQNQCDHSWMGMKARDPEYSPRVDGRGVGAEVIKYFRCEKCNLHKPFNGLPFDVCHMCGGRMLRDREERYGDARVFVHKCENCGHEYDTT